VTTAERGTPSEETTRWTSVPNPPRERPRAWSPGSPSTFFPPGPGGRPAGPDRAAVAAPQREVDPAPGVELHLEPLRHPAGRAVEAYAEGRNKKFWHPFEAYGRDRSEANAKHLHKHLSVEDNRWHYTHRARNVEAFSPDTWTLDFAILSWPGNAANRAALFYDTRSNLEDYSKWRAYFRKLQPPTLVVWGRAAGS
jgi:hypothetical protein